MNNRAKSAKSKFGLFQHFKRPAAVVALEKVKKINKEIRKDGEWAKNANQKKPFVSRSRSNVIMDSSSSESESEDSDEEFAPMSGRVNVRAKVSPTPPTIRLSGVPVTITKRNEGTKISGNKIMDSSTSSESGGSQQESEVDPPKKKGRPFKIPKMEKVKEEDKDSKDKDKDFPRIPEHIKLAIQLMLTTYYGGRGLNAALVEKQFHHVFPDFRNFKSTDYGFGTFELMLKSPQMKTYCVHSRIQWQSMCFGHGVSSTEAKLRWDSKNKYFSITPKEGHFTPPPATPVPTLPKAKSPENSSQELPKEQQQQKRVSTATSTSTASVQTVSAQTPRPEEKTMRLLVPKVVAVVKTSTSTVQQGLPTAPSTTTNNENAPVAVAVAGNNDPKATNISITGVNVNQEIVSESATATPTTAATTSTSTQVQNSMDQDQVVVPPTNTNYEKAAEMLIHHPNVKFLLEQLVSTMQNENNQPSGPASVDPGPIITSVKGGVGPEQFLFPVPQPQPANVSDGRNCFAPEDDFHQFYRRNEVPQGYSLQCGNDNNTGYPTYSDEGTDQGTRAEVSDGNDESNYNMQYKRVNRGRSPFKPRGRQDFNWNRNSRGDRPPPLLPHPTIVEGRRNGNARSRWSPNGVDYQRHRPYYFVARDFSREESSGGGGRRRERGGDRFRPQNSREQNMAFSYALLQRARVISDMRKNSARPVSPAPVPPPLIELDDNRGRSSPEEQRVSRNLSPVRDLQH